MAAPNEGATLKATRSHASGLINARNYKKIINAIRLNANKSPMTNGLKAAIPPEICATGNFSADYTADVERISKTSPLFGVCCHCVSDEEKKCLKM